MTISWVDNSTDELGFRVERATAADADLTDYQAIGLTAATT